MQVPQFDTPLLLDLLFGVVILLFVPFGIRRGVAREAIVSAAILLSGLVANAWAPAWGDWVAATLGFDANVSRFVITVLILLVGLLILGYGGGGAVPRSAISIPSRLMGGLLAAFNGAYLLSLVLNAYERDLREGTTVSGTYIGGELLRDMSRLLLGAGIVLLVCSFFGWLVRGRSPQPVAEPALPVPPRQRPVRVPTEPEAGKYEPGLPSQAAYPTAETAPLPVQPDASDGNGTGGAWWRPAAPSPAANGHAPEEGTDWSARGGASSSWQAWRDQAYGRTTEVPTGEGGRRFAGGASSTVSDDRERCPTCGARVAAGDLFCPSCGKTL